MRQDAYTDTLRHDNDRHASVLVVEDEPLVRLDIALALSDAGFAVIETGTAEDALDILRTRRGVGVVFSDVELPGMNGLSLRDEIARDFPHIAVLLTSGSTGNKMHAVREESTFIAKPYDPSRVVSTVRQVAA